MTFMSKREEPTLVGNKWVKEFVEWIINTIRDRKEIDVLQLCILGVAEKNTPSKTTRKCIKSLQLANIVKIEGYEPYRITDDHRKVVLVE